MKRISIFFIFLFAMTAGHAQENHGLVNWMSINEAMAKVKSQPRPILIDFYTDWCGWCKTMIKTTYSDKDIATYINTYFYPVQFDAEGKDSVNYLGKIYKPSAPGPRVPHPFAVEMLKEKLMYPSTIFLNGYDTAKNEFRLNLMAQGYLDQKKIQPMLVYTVENIFKSTSPDDFRSLFEKAFAPVDISETPANKFQWLEASEGLGKGDTGKKTIVFINAAWCNSCRVMNQAVFTDSLVSMQLSKFRLVNFNAEYTDTVQFHGQPFVNQKNPQAPFHQLAIALMKNNFTLPTLAILDEKNNLLDAIQFFVTPPVLTGILEYYGNDIYRSKSWNEFQSSKKNK